MNQILEEGKLGEDDLFEDTMVDLSIDDAQQAAKDIGELRRVGRAGVRLVGGSSEEAVIIGKQVEAFLAEYEDAEDVDGVEPEVRVPMRKIAENVRGLVWDGFGDMGRSFHNVKFLGGRAFPILAHADVFSNNGGGGAGWSDFVALIRHLTDVDLPSNGNTLAFNSPVTVRTLLEADDGDFPLAKEVKLQLESLRYLADLSDLAVEDLEVLDRFFGYEMGAIFSKMGTFERYQSFNLILEFLVRNLKKVDEIASISWDVRGRILIFNDLADLHGRMVKEIDMDDQFSSQRWARLYRMSGF